MVKLISNLVCLVYILDLRIVVGENLLTQEQFERLSETKVYKALIEKNKKTGKGFEVFDVEEADATEEVGEKTVDKMTKAELTAYAKSLGIEGLSGKSKDELIALIQAVEEE